MERKRFFLLLSARILISAAFFSLGERRGDGIFANLTRRGRQRERARERGAVLFSFPFF